MTPDQLIEAGQDPLVVAIINLFGARVFGVEEPEQPQQEEQMELL